MLHLDIDGALEKINRANKHITDLDGERVAFLATDPCKLRPQYDLKTNRTSYVVEHVAHIPVNISLIAGDAIHNLRSALDHLAAALVRYGGSVPSSATGFPIFKSREKYIAESPRKVEGMSSTDKERVGLLKPYHGGNDLLWGLHRADIIDKHDLLITYAQCVRGLNHWTSDAEIESLTGSGFFGERPSTEKWTVTVPFINPVPIPKEGYIIMSLIGNLEENQDMQPAFDIALSDIEVFKGRSILPTMKELSSLVEDIVVGFM